MIVSLPPIWTGIRLSWRSWAYRGSQCLNRRQIGLEPLFPSPRAVRTQQLQQARLQLVDRLRAVRRSLGLIRVNHNDAGIEECESFVARFRGCSVRISSHSIYQRTPSSA